MQLRKILGLGGYLFLGIINRIDLKLYPNGLLEIVLNTLNTYPYLFSNLFFFPFVNLFLTTPITLKIEPRSLIHAFWTPPRGKG